MEQLVEQLALALKFPSINQRGQVHCDSVRITAPPGSTESSGDKRNSCACE
jgi:hypothetical protein